MCICKNNNFLYFLFYPQFHKDELKLAVDSCYVDPDIMYSIFRQEGFFINQKTSYQETLTKVCNMKNTLEKYKNNKDISTNDSESKELEEACLNKNTKAIKSIIEKNDVVVTGTCIKAVSMHSKTKFTGDLIDNYDFTDINDKAIKEKKDAIVPTKYKACDRILYFCRLNNPLEKFKDIRNDFVTNLDAKELDDKVGKVSIVIDKDGSISKYDIKDIDNKEYTIEAELPEDFRKILSP